MKRMLKATAVMAVLASLALAPSMALAAPTPVHLGSAATAHLGLFDMILQLIGLSPATASGGEGLGAGPSRPSTSPAMNPSPARNYSTEGAIWGRCQYFPC